MSERRASESNELLGNKDDLLPTSEVLTLALLTHSRFLYSLILPLSHTHAYTR